MRMIHDVSVPYLVGRVLLQMEYLSECNDLQSFCSLLSREGSPAEFTYEIEVSIGFLFPT